MKRAVLLIALAGCSSGPSNSQGQAPPRQPPPDAVGGFFVELPSQTLMPGEETLPCFVMPLDLMGPSRVVGGATLTVGPGMHHGNVTARKAHAMPGPRECFDDERGDARQALDVADGGAVLFGSSTQISGQEWQSFPKGMGYRLHDGLEIVARMHYLNATSQPITVTPRYQWYTIDEAKLTQEIAPFLWDNKDINVPPLGDQTITGKCAFPATMHVVTAMPHMHKLGTSFRAGFLGGKLDGQAWLDSPGYDPEKGVMQQYDPSIDLGQADGAWFSCSWHNTLNEQITYGIGDNEMCILFGYAWPPEAAFTAEVKNGNCVVVNAAN
jgi:hypothetical protein